jgi:hypothetical protein
MLQQVCSADQGVMAKMIFYESIYEACQELSESERLQVYKSVIEYGCAGILPDNLSGTAKAIFIMAKPLIDANAQKKANGKKGGRPKKEETLPQRTAGKFINFKQSGTDWNAVADKIMETQVM